MAVTVVSMQTHPILSADTAVKGMAFPLYMGSAADMGRRPRRLAPWMKSLQAILFAPCNLDCPNNATPTQRSTPTKAFASSFIDRIPPCGSGGLAEEF